MTTDTTPTHSTVEVTHSDAEFLRDLAQRIFLVASPLHGFDQGDVDRLYRLASQPTDRAERSLRKAVA